MSLKLEKHSSVVLSLRREPANTQTAAGKRMPTISTGFFWRLRQGGTVLEDVADRLNHVWTVVLLLVLAAVISWRQNFYQASTCWCPSQFTGSMRAYVENGVWHSNRIIYGSGLPQVRDVYQQVSHADYENEAGSATIYQWIPFIFCFQALLFKLPYVILYMFHSYSGISFQNISGLTSGYANLNINERERLASQVARYIKTWSTSSLLAGLLPWRLLSLLWLLVKILFVVNVVAQLSLLDRILYDVNSNMTYSSFINRFTAPMVNDSIWPEYPTLPIKVLFTFDIIQIQNVQTYTLQCIIPANKYTSIGITVVRIWLVFVAVVTIASLLARLAKSFPPFMRRRYVKKYLEMQENSDRRYTDFEVNKIADSVLGEDGVLVLKLIEANSSEIFIMQVVSSLFALTSGGHVPVICTSAYVASSSGATEVSLDMRHSQSVEPSGADDAVLMKQMNI